MTAEELLEQLGISLEEAKAFLISNISSPQTIYNIAAQYSVSFDMLAEIYGDDDIDESIVRSFFSNQGYDTTSDTPTLEDLLDDSASEDDSSDDDSSDDDILSFDLDSILSLDVTSLSSDDWDQILLDYQSSIANFDWSSFGDELSQLLLEFDWEAWASELQELANSLASDSSWLSDFEDWYEAIAGTDFDDTFDRSEWIWDDVDEYLDELDDYIEDAIANFDFSAIDWTLYEDALAAFGMTTTDIETLISQLETVDLSLYADLFENLGFDISESASIEVQPVGVSADFSLELS